MKTIHAIFTLEKETKGSFRFQEIDNALGHVLPPGAFKIGSLYIRKSALDGAAPRRIVVTIEDENTGRTGDDT